MSMLGIALTGSQERAVRRLIRFLDGAAACYQFSGGFAGNLYGSRWPLHDLDVDAAQQDLPRLAELLQPYIYHPPLSRRMRSFGYTSCARSSRAWTLT